MTSISQNANNFSQTLVQRLRATAKRIGVQTLPRKANQPKTCPHGGRVYETIGQDFSQLESRKEVLAADVLDAWYPPAPSVLKVLEDNLTWSARTSPPLHADGLREVIAKNRGIEPSQIVLGCGSSDLIFRIVPEFLDGSGPIVIPQPSYAEYRHVLTNLHGRSVVPFYTDSNDFVLNVEELLRFAKSVAASSVCLVNPCNPTGFALTKDKMLQLLDALERLRIVVDETYIDYIGKEESLETLVEKYPNLLILKSVSKFYALSGMRIGYAVTSAKRAIQYRNATPPYIVSTPGQMAAIAAFNAEEYYLDRVAQTHRLRQSFSEALEKLPGIRVMPSNINCLLLDLRETGWVAHEFWEELRRKKLLSRDISHQGLEESGRYIRVAVLSESDNLKMVEIISEVLAMKSPVANDDSFSEILCA